MDISSLFTRQPTNSGKQILVGMSKWEDAQIEKRESQSKQDVLARENRERAENLSEYSQEMQKFESLVQTLQSADGSVHDKNGNAGQVEIDMKNVGGEGTGILKGGEFVSLEGLEKNTWWSEFLPEKTEYHIDQSSGTITVYQEESKPKPGKFDSNRLPPWERRVRVPDRVFELDVNNQTYKDTKGEFRESLKEAYISDASLLPS